MFQGDVNAFWKNKFIECFKQIEPNFTIDKRNKKLISVLYAYVWNRLGRAVEGSLLEANKGLFLYGSIGTGKSTILKALRAYENYINQYCFAFSNNLLSYQFVSATEIALNYSQKGIEGIVGYTERDCMYNLAIDELGRESDDAKHFGTNLNVIQTVLQLRYEQRNNFITHVSTNLQLEDISARYGDYIADRVKEMFNIIPMSGESRRK